MMYTLSLPPFSEDERAEFAESGETLVDDYWMTHNIKTPTSVWEHVWTQMWTRDSETATSFVTYYRFPDGTIIDDGTKWSQYMSAATRDLGYTSENKDAFAYDYEKISIEDIPKALELAAAYAREDKWYMFVEQVDDPFQEEFIGEL